MMASCLCISIHFLRPFSHGRNENGQPEWPPSPLRLLQALVAASAGRWNEHTVIARAVPAIRWFETLPSPEIVAARAVASEHPHRLYVPDNVADKVAASWSRGRDACMADYRTEKDVLPAHLDGDAVHYLYALPESTVDQSAHIETIVAAARSVTHLGWGVDVAIGDAKVITPQEASELAGQRWLPSPASGTPLRSPKPGTLCDLMQKHSNFLKRISDDGFRPVPPLRVFDVIRYRRPDQPLIRPYHVFELRNADGSQSRYPPRNLIHIAGMVRHLAIEAMKKDPPQSVDAGWVETYIAGHCASGTANALAKSKCVDEADNEGQAQVLAAGDEHRQLSYLPLPSVGHEHTDPGVRRVMIVAPLGDDALLDHVARRLAGQPLKPLRGDEFAGREPPILVRVRHDNVVRCYTEPARVWHSFTPVILPGHDDHKPQKTRSLIERALQTSGIDHPCEFEWSAFSTFPRSYSAHKYGSDKRPQGYFRPDYLMTQTAVHLTVRFGDGLRVPGPIAIGAGRHCGFGLMVREQNQ